MQYLCCRTTQPITQALKLKGYTKQFIDSATRKKDHIASNRIQESAFFISEKMNGLEVDKQIRKVPYSGKLSREKTIEVLWLFTKLGAWHLLVAPGSNP